MLLAAGTLRAGDTRPKWPAGEFPKSDAVERVGGELASAEFYLRRGTFRASQTGELQDFALPPYGSVMCLNAEADLRDLPLGTFCVFSLIPDPSGAPVRLVTVQDQFTLDARQGFTYRLDELHLGEGKLLTTRHGASAAQADLGRRELHVNDLTRLWKGDKQVQVSDLAVGDELLFNLTGTVPSNANAQAATAPMPGVCTDIWIGADTHHHVTAEQRKRHAEFLKARGLPGWIDAIDGNKLSVTLFSGDPENFQPLLDDFAVGKELSTVVANQELRTWNPGTDRERSTLLEIQKTPVDAYGTSGVRLVFTVANMLEGFRRGRVVRVFGPGYRPKDMPCGEGLMNYGYSRLQTTEIIEITPREYAGQFPFRTDYGNAHLPWYQLQEGKQPPLYAEHQVLGELAQAEDDTHGQFRTDRTGELVNFTLIPGASVRRLNTDAKLAEIPTGTRCRFHLFQDDHGAFTRASLVSDEFSYQAANGLTYRIEGLRLAEGKVLAARQIHEVKNYNGDMEQPPNIGRAELPVDATTHIWKGETPVQLSELAVGDLLLFNISGEHPGVRARCTEIWVGKETHKLVTDDLTQKHKAGKK